MIWRVWHSILSINLSIDQSINQSINQSVSQSINLLLIDQSVCHSINHRSITQSLSQSINQSTTQSVSQLMSVVISGSRIIIIYLPVTPTIRSRRLMAWGQLNNRIGLLLAVRVVQLKILTISSTSRHQGRFFGHNCLCHQFVNQLF